MTPHANMSTAAVELTTSVINNSVEFTSTLADFNATTASMLSTSAVVTTQAPPPAVEGRCLNILYEDIGESRVRIWDILFLVPNSLFLMFILLRMRCIYRRIVTSNQQGGSLIFPTYFALVFISTVLGFVRCIVSMTVDLASFSGTDANKYLWLILRFFLLMSELSVLVFGLAFGHLDSKNSIKRVLLVTTFVALVYSSIQTYLEIHHDDPRYDIIEDKWTVFEHGGSLFSFTSSLIFLLLYTFVIILPYIKWLQRYLLVPTRPSFYIYVAVIFAINLLASVGSGLFYYQQSDAGLCLLDLSTILYYGYFSPLVYFTFLTAYFTTAGAGQGYPSSASNILFSYNSQVDDDEFNDVVDYDVNAFNIDSSGLVLEFHEQQHESPATTPSGDDESRMKWFGRGSGYRSNQQQQQLHDMSQLGEQLDSDSHHGDATVAYK